MTVPHMTCLCLLTRSDRGRREVLMGVKKRGFGAGRLVGPGGHVEPGETPARAAARETEEESGLVVDPASLTELAVVSFRFPSRPAWDLVMTVFGGDAWSGEVVESDEIAGRWLPVDEMPYGDMWGDARYWLPAVLAGRRLRADVTYADDCATVATAHITDLAA